MKIRGPPILGTCVTRKRSSALAAERLCAPLTLSAPIPRGRCTLPTPYAAIRSRTQAAPATHRGQIPCLNNNGIISTPAGASSPSGERWGVKAYRSRTEISILGDPSARVFEVFLKVSQSWVSSRRNGALLTSGGMSRAWLRLLARLQSPALFGLHPQRLWRTSGCECTMRYFSLFTFNSFFFFFFNPRF